MFTVTEGRRLEPCLRSTANVAVGWPAGMTLFALYVASAVNADQPVVPPECGMRLSVEVTPDVPNPGSGGFISSLLGNHPEYQLYLVRVADDTHVVLQLQGPGPAERCQSIVDSMGADGRVLSISTT